MKVWREFFTVGEDAAEAAVPAAIVRLAGADGGAAASGGEVAGPERLVDPAIFGADGGRPGHITSPVPLVHPRLRARVGALLGLSAAQVAAVARYDTCVVAGEFVAQERVGELDFEVILENGGGAALGRLLVERGRGELVLERVPVLPPRERPWVVGDAGEPVPGPIDRAYERLFAAIAGYRSYVEVDAPSMLLMAQWERAQDSFDALCRTIAGEEEEPFALDDAWLQGWAAALARSRAQPEKEGRYFEVLRGALVPGPPRPPLPYHGRHVDPLTPLECRFAGPDAAMLVLPHAVAVVDLATGALRCAAPATSCEVIAVTPAGDLAVFVARGDVLAQVHALDLRRGVYLDGWAGRTPPEFPMGPYKSEEWCVYDYGRRVARPLPGPGSYKGGAVLSPCLRYAWIDGTGRIFRVSDLLPQFELAALPRGPRPPARALWRRGEQPPGIAAEDPAVFPLARAPFEREDEGEVEEDDEDVDPRVAFALAADGFRAVWQAALYVRRAPVLRLGRPFSAVALDVAGERLMVAYPGALEIVTIDVAGRPGAPRVVSLAGLEEALTLAPLRGRVPGLTREVEAQLLAHLGTVAAIRAAPVEALVRDEAFAPMLEDSYAPLDPGLVRAIVAALG